MKAGELTNLLSTFFLFFFYYKLRVTACFVTAKELLKVTWTSQTSWSPGKIHKLATVLDICSQLLWLSFYFSNLSFFFFFFYLSVTGNTQDFRIMKLLLLHISILLAFVWYEIKYHRWEKGSVTNSLVLQWWWPKVI